MTCAVGWKSIRVFRQTARRDVRLTRVIHRQTFRILRQPLLGSDRGARTILPLTTKCQGGDRTTDPDRTIPRHRGVQRSDSPVGDHASFIADFSRRTRCDGKGSVHDSRSGQSDIVGFLDNRIFTIATREDIRLPVDAENAVCTHDFGHTCGRICRKTVRVAGVACRGDIGLTGIVRRKTTGIAGVSARCNVRLTRRTRAIDMRNCLYEVIIVAAIIQNTVASILSLTLCCCGAK